MMVDENDVEKKNDVDVEKITRVDIWIFLSCNQGKAFLICKIFQYFSYRTNIPKHFCRCHSSILTQSHFQQKHWRTKD